MADSDRYYDTGSAVNSRSSSFSSGPSGLRGSHSDTRLYERTRSLRRNSSSSMSCVEASDSSSIHDSDKVHFLVKKFPWRTHWRSMDNVSSSCSSRSSVLDDDVNKLHWKTKTAYRDNLPPDDTSQSQLQVKYGSFKEVDEETEELKTDPTDWSSHCLITPTPIHLARISDTESEKYTHSPALHVNTLRDTEHEMSLSHSSKMIPTRHAKLQPRVQEQNSSFPLACQLLAAQSSVCGDSENCSEYNLSYKSAAEGSLESLDKYETAIRDDELTVSDEQNSKDLFHYKRGHEMETFSEFEEDLRQRLIKSIPANASVGSSSQHSSISDYIDRDKPFHTVSSSVSDQNTIPSQGSPNIMKIKYKGTKGFGQSPRIEYNKIEESGTQTLLQNSHTSANNCENADNLY